MKNIENCLTSLTHGALLVTGKAHPNVMTIGWGFVGYMWRKKVFIAPIRESRFTHELIENNGTFTVSFPKSGDMTNIIKVAGTRSGRDVDKFQELGLEKVVAPLADSYFVGGAEDYLECRLIGKIDLDPAQLQDEAKAFYKDGDVHTLYFGEILE